ncbi:MAG: hypothetical protein JSV17_04820 [Candidatus Aminicenantes bacterium]|nr:MAG: hypothetical protein JSV17_04820 [Candidatus Aminicenantes bacterium]
MYRNLIIVIVVILGFAASLPAQVCGPGCPVCSGSGQSTGALLPPGTFVSTGMAIPGGEEETGVFNLRAGVNSWLDLGLGYTFKSDKFIWSLRLQPISENEESWRPAVIVGTGSVQTGRSDQSAFIQVTKSFEFSEIISARFSIGIASLLPDFDKEYFLAGITLTVTEQWSPFFSYDGINYHVGLSWIPKDWLFVTGIMVEMKNPAILVGFRWGFDKKTSLVE